MLIVQGSYVAPIPTPRKPAGPKVRVVWDNYEEIGEVLKTESKKIVVGAGIKDGVHYINLREFYITKKEQIWKPSHYGITVPLLRPIEQGTKLLRPYEGLIELLVKTAEYLPTMELYDDEKKVTYIKEPK